MKRNNIEQKMAITVLILEKNPETFFMIVITKLTMTLLPSISPRLKTKSLEYSYKILGSSSCHLQNKEIGLVDFKSRSSKTGQ